jgi:hypothetical protein
MTTGKPARRLVFQLAEVLVTREMLTGMLAASPRTWLACIESTGIYDSRWVFQRKQAAQGSDLGGGRRCQDVALRREVVTSREWSS